MKIFFCIIFLFCLLIIINSSNTTKNITLETGIYNIISALKYSSLYFDKNEIILKKENLGSDSINFRLKFKKFGINANKNYSNIQHLKSSSFLGIKVNKENNTNNTYVTLTKEIYENSSFSFSYFIKETETNIYTIKSDLGCYLCEDNHKLKCSFGSLTRNCKFYLLKIFSELDTIDENDLELIEKEPIDVLIKYIDLSDPDLKRDGIKQINKDQQNDELRYSLRSILQNIPWVRKIFILMPNEKVKFLKSPELINDKIVFVKDKDLLGYDSANSHAFQFRYWKMKEFGMSDNFIAMDDDYFIGKPLNKSDLFYVQNGTVVPAIIATNYQIHTKKTFLREYNTVKKNLETSRAHSSNNFMYSVYNTYSFFIDEFKSPIIVPYFTHNAIPTNVKDLKEIYNLVYNSKYRNGTLDSLYRDIETIQFQTAVMIYTFNRYLRKVNLIKYSYIDAEQTIKGNYNAALFCINTGGNKDYSEISFKEEKIVMNKLFPYPTPYEIINYTDIPYTSFELIKKIEDDISKLNQVKKEDEKERGSKSRNNKKDKDKNNIVELQKDSKEKTEFINGYKGKSYDLKSRNTKLLSEISKIKEDYYDCLSKKDFLDKEINNFLQSEKENSTKNKDDIENLKKELNKNIDMKKNNIIKLNNYIKKRNDNIEKLRLLEMKEYKLNFIIIFEFIVLIVLLIIFFLLYINRTDNHKKNDKEENLLEII